MAYDFQSKRSMPLHLYPLPSQQVGTGGYSWDPTMQRGITSDGNGRGLYEQLYWLNQDQPETFDVGLPQVFAATWAPDGSQIAFLGAPEQGLTGIGRADASFNLYLMASDGTHPQVVLPGLQYVASLTWSPDSHWMLLPASLTADRKDAAVWLIERSTGNYRQIAQGVFATPAWSPDGQHIVLLEYRGEYPNETVQLVILDVAALVRAS
jgi:Tol biopolymer transport system component